MNRALHIVAAYLANDARVKSYITILKNAGWLVDVISYEEEGLPDYDEKDGYRVFRIAPKYQGKSVLKYLHSYLKFYIRAKKLAKALHKKHNYNIVHVHNMPNFLVGIPNILRPKPRIILDMHDLMSINFKTKFGNSKLATSAILAEERWSITRADRIICADKGQKSIIDKLHPSAEPTVIMNLANTEIFKWGDHSWESGVFRFVYHGTFAHRLGVDRVLKALTELPENIVFRMIGDGDEKENLLKLIQDYNIKNRVEVFPIIPVEQLPEMLKDCHAGIVPSRKTEATDSAMLPVKLLEYSALGIPSVVSNLKNIRMHFAENQVLYFAAESHVSMLEAMIKIYNYKDVRECIRAELLSYNKNNSWTSGGILYRECIMRSL